MKWLEANPIGVALAATSGFFLLLVLIMTVVWNLPVSVEIDESSNENITGADRPVVVAKIADLREYEVINEKPVFNESRLPVIDDVGSELLDDDSGTGITIADAPDVRLTGIIITPTLRIVSLTPADGNIETVTVHEGEDLTGEFLGWGVSTINPRHVVLESRDGRTVKLELEVHDKKIEEPPKLAVADNNALAKAVAESNPAQPEAASGEEAPLSRAEQIRKRIAERREELRRQQEQGTQRTGARRNASPRSNEPTAYQKAIQAKIRNERKDESGDNDEDG